MNVVSISYTTHVNIEIPKHIKVFDDDKTLMLKSESVGDIAAWLREALEEVESYL